MTKKLHIFFWFLLFYALLCFVSLNRHSHAKPYSYHTELWADKAGYNIYLPATFIYHFTTSNFSKEFEKNTGYGFSIDTINNKITTKYPYGVSLLQSPFWLIAHTLSSNKDGYSVFYQKSIDFAGVFYLCLGLFVLYFLLKQYITQQRTVLLIALFTISSGVFYYGIFETGMSHIYSFSILSGIIYILFNKKQTSTFYSIYLLSILTVLYIIIRPINSIFILILFGFILSQNTTKLLSINTFKQLSFFQITLIIVSCVGLIVPQLLFYKYAFNSFFTNSYQGESFVFPTTQRFIQLLFSPNNGLLIYYPVIGLLLIYTFIYKYPYRYLLLTLTVVYILVYASWWSLSLGCGFGHRAFNDIVVLLFIPFMFHKALLNKWFILIIILFTLINLKFILSYDGCLFTSDKWDYTEYSSILFGEFK